MDASLSRDATPSTPPDALAQLELTPEQAGQLTGHRRDALIRFLLRWEQYAPALACLDALLATNPELVTLLDQRAQALAGLRRYGEALQTMRQRHELRVSASSLALEARIYLAGGVAEGALSAAEEALRESSNNLSALAALAEARLARGDYEAAQAACRRMNEVAPDSRAYWLEMIGYHQARGELTAASGYAARLEAGIAEVGQLAPHVLRRLREFYLLSGELNRVRDIEAALTQMYEQELAELGPILSESLAAIARRAQAVEPTAPPESSQLPVAATLTAAQPAPAIVVTAGERLTIERAAREIFGHSNLLPGQAETLAAALRGQDALTILRTGGGKSLCYQLPAFMAQSGATLVVSPLIALMKDQVESLPAALRERAVTINSTLDGDELQVVLQRLAQGQYRLVYAAPERMRQVTFMHALRRAGVNRLVVDEAHCVSMWGHDFRPDYLYLGRARQALGSPPVLAMTATAPPRVRLDILQRLDMEGAAIITGEVTRPNLYLAAYRARNQDDKLGDLLALIQREPGSGIVYVSSRERAEELAQLLQQRGVAAGFYHAGIGDRAQREAAQDVFMRGEVRVMTATIAFGMGIDKPDIRFIIHYDLPSSLESYYQEAGRAGRDGQPAHCLLLYTANDKGTLTMRRHSDQIHIEKLRGVYAAVKRRLGGQGLGRVAMGDLARDAQLEETQTRVALSLLEEAGLLRRHHDAPRSARVLLRASYRSDPDLAALAAAAHLAPGEAQSLDLIQCAIQAKLDPLAIEARMLAWADAGWAQYRPAGHDLLIEILPTPENSATVVKELLDRYENIQIQRIAEIMAYAQTRRCRHGYISAYLSGESAEHCRSCDNCQPAQAPSTKADLPEEGEQLAAILRCLVETRTSWGRRNLIRILRADKEAPPRGQRCSAWGALAYRTEKAIGEMVDRLVGAGMLHVLLLEHGGAALELTPAGRAALADHAQLDALARPLRSGAAAARSIEEEIGPVDEELLEALHEWRKAAAQQAAVPHYIIAHNELLARIAAARPATLIELAQIRGIGKRKLVAYGEAILDIVAAYRKE